MWMNGAVVKGGYGYNIAAGVLDLDTALKAIRRRDFLRPRIYRKTGFSGRG
jgi:hypothetical protein